MTRASFTTRSTSKSKNNNSDLESGRQENEDEEQEEEEDEFNESDELLIHHHNNNLARLGSSSKISSNYGSTHHNHNHHSHYIHLDNQDLDNLSTLQRSESILKVQHLIDDRGGEYESFRKDQHDLDLIKSAKVKRFYIRQNSILDSFLEVDAILDNVRALGEHTEGPPEISSATAQKRESLAGLVKLAINVNILVNIGLLGAKIAVVLLSNSMSLIASTVDSAMDFLSTLIIYGTSKVIENKNWRSDYEFPTGKRRMEPMSVLIFSVVSESKFSPVMSCRR
jgi:hypothetical protein